MNSLITRTRGRQLNKQRSWFVRTYRKGDEGQLFELRKAVHPERQYVQQQWLRWWHWVHKETPSGGKTWLAEDNGRIVGQLTNFIVNLKVGNDIVKARFTANLTTHPDYRRQGIMSTIIKNMRADHEQRGILISFGFPNSTSHALGMTVGHFDVAGGRKMIRVLKWENALKTRISHKLLLKLCIISGNTLSKILCRASKAPVVKGLAITQVSRFDERINEFWARVSNQFQIMVVRSKDYLNWRYVTVPDVSYSIYVAEKAETIYGYIVLRCHQGEYRKVAVIYDLLAESEEIVQCLLATAIDHCRRAGMDYIYWVGIANKSYLRAFRKRGFISNPFKKEGTFIAYSSAPNISREFLRKAQNWLIQIGDSDIL